MAHSNRVVLVAALALTACTAVLLQIQSLLTSPGTVEEVALPLGMHSALAGGIQAPSYVTSPLPANTVKASDLPGSWDWRNVDGTNYVAPVRNQDLPQPCGSCWAVSSVGALSSRVKIARKAAWPEVNLSPQVALNCADHGKCGDGNPGFVYDFARRHGLPDDTCAPYLAEKKQCTPEETCKHCSGTVCTAVNEILYKKIKVAEHGEIHRDVHAMKAEIYKRGPIACFVRPTQSFDSLHWNYQGAFIPKDEPNSMHWVQVVGWEAATTTQPEAWIVQNSWGTFWGDQGFARIPVGHDDSDVLANLDINRFCVWAVPDV